MRVLILLACLIALIEAKAKIFPRHPSRPPFLFGRPAGGIKETLWYQRQNRVGRERVVKADDPYPQVQTFYFNQTLDHFSKDSSGTWLQKYYYNPQFYRGHEIIFLMIGGEGPESKKWAGNGDVQYLQWAKEYGAAVFDLEHRFFGDSFPVPNNMSTTSLALLTTEQALEDLSTFIQAMNKQYNFKNPRWVTFGGSYPGSLSAWFRAKYSSLTVGAVASSAPLELKLDFYEYAMMVQDDLVITDSKCADNIRAAFDQMQQLSISVEGRNKLNTNFKLLPPFDDKTTMLDITNFFANIYSTFQGMTQYEYDGQNVNTETNLTDRAVCNIMNDNTEPDLTKRVYNVFLWSNEFYAPDDPNYASFPNSYWDMINSMKNDNANQMDENGSMRGWMWLSCNELGFLQTTDQGSNLFGSTVPLNYFVDTCTDMFDPTFVMPKIEANNKQAQKYYGGANDYTATNVVLPNGSLDPWHALGTYVLNNATNQVPILINGTAHCSDMYPSYNGEPVGLTDARQKIHDLVGIFINYDPTKDGPNVTSIIV